MARSLPIPTLRATRRTIGEYWWSAQYQQRPSPAGGGVFKREWFRTFDTLGDAYRLGEIVTPKSVCRRFCTVDLAVSTSTRADYTVIATWAVTPTKDLLLIDLVRDRFEAPDIVPALRRTYEQHHPAQIGIERAGFQLALIQEARRAGLPIHELIPDADKLSRALPAAARMEGGQVAWPATAPWRGALEAELLTFPHGTHDDQIDALAYAAAELARGSHGDVTISVATGMLPSRSYHGDPAADIAARRGAVLYSSTADHRERRANTRVWR